MSEEEISDGKKAMEAEVSKLAAEAGLTSTTYAWVERDNYYYLIAFFGDYYIEWPFSKEQLEESSSGNLCSSISRTLRRKINSLRT